MLSQALLRTAVASAVWELLQVVSFMAAALQSQAVAQED